MGEQGAIPSMYEMRSLPQSSLPAPLTPLVGREQEIAAVCALLWRPEVRLVTLTGTGGVGKTRLALGVAAAVNADFADGICFVALAPLIDPGLVLSTIAQALGVQEQGSRPLLEGLQDHLREKQLLLLLDNFEQVVSAAPVVAELLVAAPRLRVLVTSRTSLHLSGEHEFVVPPLALPDLRNLPPPDRLRQYGAIRLFVARAQAAHSAFVMTGENATAIAAICQQVDGLPLAIELAAGRSKLFAPQALLSRLRNRLKLLVGGAQDLPLRQQTLRGTIAWSYDLLGQDEKTLFRRLAVFVGGCTLEAAEAVCIAQGDLLIDVLEAVAALVDKSLLRQETQADGQPRLLMLETIREYALERLAASGEAEAVRRHERWRCWHMERCCKAISAPRVSWQKRGCGCSGRWGRRGARPWRSITSAGQRWSWAIPLPHAPSSRRARRCSAPGTCSAWRCRSIPWGGWPCARGMTPVRAPTARKPWQSHGRRATSSSSPKRWPSWERSPCMWVTLGKPRRSISRAW